ncbi:MAG: response regulator [Frankiaceae bacterium]
MDELVPVPRPAGSPDHGLMKPERKPSRTVAFLAPPDSPRCRLMARVLVVDDDPDILLLVQIRLRNAGYEVYSVTNALDALAILDNLGLPDVAVLDVGLPGITPPEDIAAGRTLGATDPTKPSIADQLLTAVHEALGD